MSGGHLDVDILATYQEHLLPHDQAVQVASHLSGCQHCARVLGQLAEVTARLAAAPPPAIPPAVAARLDAALTGEAQRGLFLFTGEDTSGATAGAPAAASASRTSSGAPGTSSGASAAQSGAPAAGGTAGRPGFHPRRGRFSRASRRRIAVRAAFTAAAAVVAAGGIYGLTRLAGSSSSGSSASSAAAPASSAGRASHESKHAAPGHAVTQPLPLVASGADYRPGRLRAEVRSVLRRYVSENATGNPFGPSVPQSVSQSFPHLDACVGRVAAGRVPELVDLARYEARPAAVIVLRAHAGHRVLVVGTGCSGAMSDVIARFSLP